MAGFRRGLIVCSGVGDGRAALELGLVLAQHSVGSLRILVVAPPLPASMLAYSSIFEKSLRDQLAQQTSAVASALGIEAACAPIPVTVEFDASPAECATRLAQRDDCELILKEVDGAGGRTGLAPVDLNILRLAPMPVWLARPRPIRPGGMRVGVAVDPLAPGLAAWGLALRMLRMGHELSRLGAFPLQVVSCWTYEYEAYLDRNPWFLRMDAAELQAAVRDADDDHCAALDRLLQEAGIDGPLRVNRIHGTAASRVPAFVEDSDLDVLLMGTSNKAGLRALLMGRAAEGILQSLRCSVLAFKPDESVPPGTRRP